MISSPPAGSDGLYYLHTDHLGSLTLMTLPGGALHSAGTARYQPFGDFQQAPPTNPGLTRHGYTNHQHHNTGDGDIGLIYMNARYYLPGLARFASPDTLIPDPANPQAFNRYTYTFNNPLIYADPSGATPYIIHARSFAPWDEFGCLVAAGRCYSGDNRNYSTSLAVTSRINSWVSIDSDHLSQPPVFGSWSDPSHRLNRQGVVTATATSLPVMNFYGSSLAFAFHYPGANPLEPLAPNIDVWVQMALQFHADQLNVSFSVAGDNYPAFEMFISDPFGSSIFLGVAPADMGQQGALTSLWGSGKSHYMHWWATMTIHLQGNGAFVGITYDDTYYTIDEWNALFLVQPTQGLHNSRYPLPEWYEDPGFNQWVGFRIY